MQRPNKVKDLPIPGINPSNLDLLSQHFHRSKQDTSDASTFPLTAKKQPSDEDQQRRESLRLNTNTQHLSKTPQTPIHHKTYQRIILKTYGTTWATLGTKSSFGSALGQSGP